MESLEKRQRRMCHRFIAGNPKCMLKGVHKVQTPNSRWHSNRCELCLRRKGFATIIESYKRDTEILVASHFLLLSAEAVNGVLPGNYSVYAAILDSVINAIVHKIMHSAVPPRAKRFAQNATERDYYRLTKNTHLASNSKIRWHHNIIQSLMSWMEWHKGRLYYTILLLFSKTLET